MIVKTKSIPLLTLVLLSVSICFIEASITADIGGKRYLIVTDKSVNWYQANHACTVQGLSLASIETEEEFNSLKRYLLDQGQSTNGYWLSGNNLGGSSTYTWLSTGNKVTLSKWASGFPTGAEQCILTDSSFKWKTDVCDSTTNTYNYICSRPLIPYCGITGLCKITRSFYF